MVHLQVEGCTTLEESLAQYVSSETVRWNAGPEQGGDQAADRTTRLVGAPVLFLQLHRAGVRDTENGGREFYKHHDKLEFGR